MIYTIKPNIYVSTVRLAKPLARREFDTRVGGRGEGERLAYIAGETVREEPKTTSLSSERTETLLATRPLAIGISAWLTRTRGFSVPHGY